MTRLRASPKRRCRVCSLPASELDLVDGGLLSGWSPRSLAGRFNTLTRKDVSAHMSKCVVSEAVSEAVSEVAQPMKAQPKEEEQ